MQNVEVRYGSALALADVSVAVDAASVLAVVGANGAGKSTLARAASGLVPVRSGTITFAGGEYTDYQDIVARPSDISAVAESLAEWIAAQRSPRGASE